jgi:hypothetical protein
MIFKSIRKKGTSKSYWVVERAGGSSFFEEPNKIEGKSPPLLHDPQPAAL